MKSKLCHPCPTWLIDFRVSSLQQNFLASLYSLIIPPLGTKQFNNNKIWKQISKKGNLYCFGLRVILLLFPLDSWGHTRGWGPEGDLAWLEADHADPGDPPLHHPRHPDRHPLRLLLSDQATQNGPDHGGGWSVLDSRHNYSVKLIHSFLEAAKINSTITNWAMNS